MTIKIDVRPVLTGQLLEDAWKLYYEAFEPLNAFTVQRHLMTRAEFDDIAQDDRIAKWLTFDDDHVNDDVPTGLATYTNDLNAWPLISPAYFQRRWPRQYAYKHIWYCGFVCIATTARKGPTFTALINAMYKVAETHCGIIALDVCQYNDEMFHLPRVIRTLLNRVSAGHVVAEQLDAQVFYGYDTAGR